MYQRFSERVAMRLERYEKQGLIKVDKKAEVATILLTLVEGFGYFRTTMGEQHPHFQNVLSFYKRQFLDVMNSTLRETPRNQTT
jgi:hypothetical protein